MANSQSISSDQRAYHQYLFDVENTFRADADYNPDKKALALRKTALSTLETCSKCDNFDAMIPFLALTYFDRLISRHQIERVLDVPEKNEDLFVICCLTIAWKLRTKSFKLDSFLSTVKSEYKVMDVFSMEINILQTLDWRVRSVTPINFADYFMKFLPRNEQNSLADRIVKEFIIRVHADYKITSYRPSVIAGYAVSATTSKLSPENLDTYLAALRGSCAKADEMTKELDTLGRALENICKKKLRHVVSESKTESAAKKAAAAEGEAAGSSYSSVEAAGGRSAATVESEMSESGVAVGGRRDGKAPMVEEDAENVEMKAIEEEEEEEEEESGQLSFEVQWGRYLEGDDSPHCVTALLACCWDRIAATFSLNS